ncbi:putative transcription factor AS2-LOB family [Helianthus anomalus]
MSCNGCRVLRKGCNENCILRQSLAAIEEDTPQAQANATVFVAKFFGRATHLMSFLSAIQVGLLWLLKVFFDVRAALFQSLLLEACGRTVNPVNGAVGLLWTGNWHVCESAVETVLRGGTIKAMSQLFSVTDSHQIGLTNVKEETRIGNASESATRSASSETKLLYFF